MREKQKAVAMSFHRTRGRSTIIMTLKPTQLVTLVFKSLERKSETLERKHVNFFFADGATNLTVKWSILEVGRWLYV